MKLATIPNGTPDGGLVVVSRDLQYAAPAHAIAATLQQALENWSVTEPALRTLSAELQTGHAPGRFAFDPAQAMAPLPRSWQWLDGSAFESHGDLMSKVFGLAPTPPGRPLMYQGVSDRFYGAEDDIPFLSEADGIDFEGEFGVVVDAVPMGTSADAAAAHIRLILLINDWSLRVLGPVEMKTGFGWVQAKPHCGVGPVAVTPDELGAAWAHGRVALNLEVDWNGNRFGAANGAAMSYSFAELVAHAARTRALCAGTIIGSGTVSNTNFREVGSSCIAERRGIELLDEGAPRTGFMRFGDTVRMQAHGADGQSVFGTLAQKVVAA